MSPKEKEYVRSTIGELVALRKSFTGEDVLKRLNSKYVRGRVEKFSCDAPAKEVSGYVRHLFNGGDVAFFGQKYGSTPSHSCGTLTGPIMFFPLPHHAKATLTKIITSLTKSSQ